MGENITIDDLTEDEVEQLKDVLQVAKGLSESIMQVMPGSDRVLEEFPAVNPMGHYSEIDMGFTERMKRCECASRLRDPLAWELYQDVKGKIQDSIGYRKMKLAMLEVSKKMNVLDRAIDLCEDDRLIEALESEREELKNAPAIKEYDKYMDAMEHYSGVKFLDSSLQHKEQIEMSTFLKEKFGVKPVNTSGLGIHEQVLNVSNPKSLEIEFENFDDFVTFQRMTDDKNMGKAPEEVKVEPVEPSDAKRYVSAMPAYIEASCDRVLGTAIPNVKDRADMIFINGESVRDMMKKEEEFKDKEPTDEQIKKYSNLYVAAALRNGSYVEAFTKSQKSGRNINYKPVPIIAKGENSYIQKKGADNEMEKITINFLDRFLAKLGFKHFKEKLKAAEIADRVKDSREAFRAAHDSEMKYPMTKQEMEEKKQAFAAIHKYKDDFLKMHEQSMNYDNMCNTLDRQFFPEGQKDIVNKTTGIQVPSGRERVRTLVVAYMLKEGYSLEQIMDTSNFIEDRERCAHILTDKLENCGEKALFETFIDYPKVLMDAIEDYAEKHNISFNDPESILGDPATYLLDLTLGTGNMPDFLLGEDYKEKMVDYFGKEEVEALDEMSRTCLAIGRLPLKIGKREEIYTYLAEGKGPKNLETTIFERAVEAEVIMKAIGAFEEPGQVFSPDLDIRQLEVIHMMVMAHPNTQKFFKETSTDRLMDVIAKGNLLKELKVDFEILDEKKMPGKTVESELFDVSIDMGNSTTAVNIVPTFEGSSAYYEMDTPENIEKKIEEMQNLQEMQNNDEIEEDMVMA